MSCDSGCELVIRCGETFRLAMENRDSKTGEMLPLLPKARATIRLTASTAPLVSLSSDAGDITIDANAGTAALVIGSDVTATLSPENERIEAWFAIEFFDDDLSPEEVESYPPESIVILPDFA